MKHYFNALENYTNFRGRATRKEFWMFILFNMIFSSAAVILDLIIASIAVGVDHALDVIAQANVLGAGISQIYIKYMLLMLIPSLAIAVRRMHDIGKSGWTIFVSAIPFIGWIWYLVLMCTESKTVDNPFSTAVEKPKKTTIQLLKTNIIMAILLWAVNFLLGFVLDRVMRGSTSYTQYITIINIFALPQLILELFVWVTWILGVLRLQQCTNHKFKSIFTTALYVFLAADVLSTITLLIQYNYNGTKPGLISILYILAEAVLFASIILSYQALKHGTSDLAADQQKRVPLSMYLFAAPSGIWYFWAIVNALLLQIVTDRGSGYAALMLIIRVLIILASIAASIVLMQVKIKGQFASNRGLHLATEEQAHTHWSLTHFKNSAAPVLIVRFAQYDDLVKALGNISFFHWDEDNQKYISSEVVEYGYYPVSDEYGAGEFVLCGTDLTLEDWQEAKNVLTAAGGTIRESKEPEFHKKLTSSPAARPSGVKFKNKYTKTGQFGTATSATYEEYTAGSKEEALAFLATKTVSQNMYYIVVETPEGNYGKDIQGVYKE